ncbi:hypothetical protein niasHT_005743 [Heterodera trifolii]|uniref:Uncharacterized protein n=1 Tax=Heterodera trifolii TaxID=157864 RepID=A0ABD2LYW1_9BILA
MSDRRKEAEEKMAKAIFISADCWLCVFDLLSPRQLGLGISMISHLFDYYVDEHFKTRKWTLAFIGIGSKMGENGTKEMEIVNGYGKRMPIPQIQMPRKVIRFEHILITFIDQNVIAFLRRFRPLFASFCPIDLSIGTTSDCVLELILRNIWPIIGENICGMFFFWNVFYCLRKFVPSLLNDCPSLRFHSFEFDGLFTEFPADDSAAASDGQAVAKWLFTPLQNNVPKMLKCLLPKDDRIWSSKIEAFKTAFASASSPVNFIVVLSIPLPFTFSVMPFDQINELTREQLALKVISNSERFLLIRCPIARDESKWTKWEEEAIGWRTDDPWNTIIIHIDDARAIGDGLLNSAPGPSDQQKK